MRPFLTFFLFVCFHFLGGLSFGSANNVSSGAHFSFPAIQSGFQPGITATMPPKARVLSKFYGRPSQVNLVNFDADEDEDDQDDASRKYQFRRGLAPAFYEAFLSNYPGLRQSSVRFSNALVADPVSCKYIRYRSIRI